MRFKEILRSVLWYGGYELRRRQPLVPAVPQAGPPERFRIQRELLQGDESPTIFDVGAHHGETVDWYRGTFEAPVNMTTVDAFLDERAIPSPDILKLDTQGSEFLVLRGSHSALRSIKLVCTEIIVMPTYKGQLAPDEVLRLFRESGFSLFGLFDPSTVNNRLRQVDALLVNDRYFAV